MPPPATFAPFADPGPGGPGPGLPSGFSRIAPQSTPRRTGIAYGLERVDHRTKRLGWLGVCDSRVNGLPDEPVDVSSACEANFAWTRAVRPRLFRDIEKQHERPPLGHSSIGATFMPSPAIGFDPTRAYKSSLIS